MNLPKPHQNKVNKLRAFVLGCDPTAFTKEEKGKLKKNEISIDEMHPIEFKKVFGIGEDKRFFAGILANLSELGLKMDDIYVQNLVTEYQKHETGKNKLWKVIAVRKIEERKQEFDNIDVSRKLPVFVTSYLLYEVLLNNKELQMSPNELYHSDKGFLIPADKNKLGRPLVPFFRHYKYSMKNQPDYAIKLIQLYNFL